MCKTAIGAMRPYCVYTRPFTATKKKKKKKKGVGFVKKRITN